MHLKKPAPCQLHQLQQIQSLAQHIFKALGCGLFERLYEAALVHECSLQEISFQQRKPYSVVYRNHEVGCFQPDLILFDQVLVLIRSTPTVSRCDMAQMYNYLRVTQLRHGLLFNFHEPQLEWQQYGLLDEGPQLISSTLYSACDDATYTIQTVHAPFPDP